MLISYFKNIYIYIDILHHYLEGFHLPPGPARLGVKDDPSVGHLPVAVEEWQSKLGKDVLDAFSGWDIVPHPPNLCIMY